MPETDNTMVVTPVPVADLEAAAPEFLTVEVAQPVEEPVAPAAHPPVFAAGQEPVADGTCATAKDGTVYYRPDFRLAERDPGLLAGPNVWFHRDDQGGIRLEWVLTDVAPVGAPAEAVPLPIDLAGASVQWTAADGNQLHRDFEALTTERGARLVVRGASGLSADDARTLELAMCDAASGCRLEVYYSYDIQVDFPGDEQLARIWLEELGITLNPNDDPTALLQMVAVDADRVKEMGIDPSRFAEVLPRSEARSDGVNRVIPFVFNPNDESNRPIYRALHGTANLTAQWRKSAAGWLRDSGFPNTVYRLPDEMRLAFNPRLGTPHVVTTLHTGDGDRTMVRVLLRVAPWQDPRKVLETRELVGSPAARVVVGPVRGTLRLGGSFPEGIRLLGGDTAGSTWFSVADGVDLLLDLSLEYYQLLCGMLGGAVGLPGQVDVVLDQDSGGGTGDGDGGSAERAPVPVELRMDKVDDLPVGVEVLASGGASPTAVRITNRAGTALTVGGCAASFLRVDAGSIVPLATYPARCTSGFPLRLDAGAAADLAFEPVAPVDGAWWNAVLVDLLDKAMVEDARAMLLKANQLAGSGELTWDLRVSCPVFAASPPPPRWADLVALEVEVSAAGFDTTTVVLRPGAPTATVVMRKPLAELVAAAAAGIRTATYRVRNGYADHQGQWTAPQQQSGEELLVYPNPAPDD